MGVAARGEPKASQGLREFRCRFHRPPRPHRQRDAEPSAFALLTYASRGDFRASVTKPTTIPLRPRWATDIRALVLKEFIVANGTGKGGGTTCAASRRG